MQPAGIWLRIGTWGWRQRGHRLSPRPAEQGDTDTGPAGLGGVLRARLFQLFRGAQSCSSSQAPAPSSVWRHNPRLLPAPLQRQQDPHRQLPPLWKLLEKVPSPVRPLAPVIPLPSRLPRHPALPKGHPGSCLVKLPIMKWHVHLMIKLLHREHERLRRTN